MLNITIATSDTDTIGYRYPLHLDTYTLISNFLQPLYANSPEHLATKKTEKLLHCLQHPSLQFQLRPHTSYAHAQPVALHYVNANGTWFITETPEHIALQQTHYLPLLSSPPLLQPNQFSIAFRLPGGKIEWSSDMFSIIQDGTTPLTLPPEMVPILQLTPTSTPFPLFVGGKFKSYRHTGVINSSILSELQAHHKWAPNDLIAPLDPNNPVIRYTLDLAPLVGPRLAVNSHVLKCSFNIALPSGQPFALQGTTEVPDISASTLLAAFTTQLHTFLISVYQFSHINTHLAPQQSYLFTTIDTPNGTWHVANTPISITWCSDSLTCWMTHQDTATSRVFHTFAHEHPLQGAHPLIEEIFLEFHNQQLQQLSC